MKLGVGTLLVVLAGCGASGAASMVRTTNAWGELTLSGPYLERVAEAVTLMAIHCDGPFAVVDHESDTGFTQTPRPEQTRIQFVCPARVEARRYAQAQGRRTAGAEEATTSRELVIPVTQPAATRDTPSANTANANTTIAPADTPSQTTPTTTSAATAPDSPALALPPPPATSSAD